MLFLQELQNIIWSDPALSIFLQLPVAWNARDLNQGQPPNTAELQACLGTYLTVLLILQTGNLNENTIIGHLILL